MDELMSGQILWAVILVGVVFGTLVLTKAPEIPVVLLLVGQNAIQFAMRLVGFDIQRRTFATAGAVIFIPVAILMVVIRMVQAREREPVIGRRNYLFIALALLMGILLLSGLTYTEARTYGAQKTREYFIFGITPMLLVFVFLRDYQAIRRFVLWVLCVAGGYVALTSVYSLVTRGTFFAALEYGGADIVAGMEIPGHVALSSPLVVAMGAVLALAAASEGGFRKYFALLALPFIAMYLILAGTRSNLLAFALVVVIGGYYAYRDRKALIAVFLLIALIVLAAGWLFAPEEVRQRMFSSWISETTASGLGGAQRLDTILRSPSEFMRSPVFGQGTGGWAVLNTGMDWYDYPHNMFVEMGVEHGIIGLSLLAALWFIVIHRLWSVLHRYGPGEEAYGLAVLGIGIMAVETGNAVAHFGLAHASCNFLLASAVVLRSTYLAETHAESQEEESVPEEGALDAGLRAQLSG